MPSQSKRQIEPVNGRWTIHTMQMGVPGKATITGVYSDDLPVPVVPVDAATVERAQAAGFDAAQVALNAQGGHLTPEDRPLFDAAITAAFRAAGEVHRG